MKEIVSRMKDQAGADTSATAYEKARELVRDPDSNIRRKLAARQDMRPEILYYLAEDASPDVRREIAANTATPAPHLILARKDSKMRCELSGKIGKLLPHCLDAQNRLRDIVIGCWNLARDQLDRVSDIVKRSRISPMRHSSSAGWRAT
jgi:hypothetical protein